jgi:hypothetical protein
MRNYLSGVLPILLAAIAAAGLAVMADIFMGEKQPPSDVAGYVPGPSVDQSSN